MSERPNPEAVEAARQALLPQRFTPSHAAAIAAAEPHLKRQHFEELKGALVMAGYNAKEDIALGVDPEEAINDAIEAALDKIEQDIDG